MISLMSRLVVVMAVVGELDELDRLNVDELEIPMTVVFLIDDVLLDIIFVVDTTIELDRIGTVVDLIIEVVC